MCLLLSIYIYLPICPNSKRGTSDGDGKRTKRKHKLANDVASFEQLGPNISTIITIMQGFGALVV